MNNDEDIAEGDVLATEWVSLGNDSQEILLANNRSSAAPSSSPTFSPVPLSWGSVFTSDSLESVAAHQVVSVWSDYTDAVSEFYRAEDRWADLAADKVRRIRHEFEFLCTIEDYVRLHGELPSWE